MLDRVRLQSQCVLIACDANSKAYRCSSIVFDSVTDRSMAEQPQKPAEFAKAYDPQQFELKWAQSWVDQGLYSPEVGAKLRAPDPKRGTFCIVIPPPNVTGYIHIGHMLEHTQIDALTRWRRMRGYRTLWLPGMDHAGIATQVVVERELAKQGLKRQEIGREEFERRVWEWKAQSGGNIKRQMMRLGASCDWSREKFTLDPPLYRSVLEAFLRLYREGLIYRGRYIVNWCPRCMTALSDLEVVHQERQGHLWHIRYPLAGSSESLVVATTRPETMLGDTAVAVHPHDERYRHLIGKKITLPLMNREIPIIGDTFVDREFGTGAVKVTPAHDPNDFEAGRRNNLPQIDVMTPDGKMNAAAGNYAGLDRFEARKRIVTDLENLGLMERITDHTNAVGICDRCKTVVEPRVSEQWFCRMKELEKEALEVVEARQIDVVPENQRTIYLNWMANIRDWCISRQLWWGHRIPIWHCADCHAMTPATDSRVDIVNGHAQAAGAPQKCAACGSANITQDNDVLDTWFSSGLWPISTLGWPDDTADLHDFYPTSLLISGYDILFFWDARMIMMCLHLMKDRRGTINERIPFRSLYLHALVRDPEGVKMSKTRGNVVDPLELIEKHGTDALRFTLAVMAAPGTDIALSEERILSYRAFANKIWNAARFIFFNLEKLQASSGTKIEELAAPAIRELAPYPMRMPKTLADRWIFSRLAHTIDIVNDALEHFRFHEAAHVVYHFFWGDFCDWYIEWIKPSLTDSNLELSIDAWRNLFAVFEAALRLLHPFMPFLTEELWHRLPQRSPAAEREGSIALERFPEPEIHWPDSEAEEQVALLQEMIAAARNMRAELKMDPKAKIPAEASSPDPEVRRLFEHNRDMVQRLASLTELRVSAEHLAADGGALRATARFDLRITHSGSADAKIDAGKLRKDHERLLRDVESKQARLADQAFRSRAPADVVAQMEMTLAQRRVELEKLTAQLAQIDGGATGSAAN
jgi:valyl-tRNA synthetase